MSLEHQRGESRRWLLPAEAYGKGDAERALQCARNLIKIAGDLTKA